MVHSAHRSCSVSIECINGGTSGFVCMTMVLREKHYFPPFINEDTDAKRR